MCFKECNVCKIKGHIGSNCRHRKQDLDGGDLNGASVSGATNNLQNKDDRPAKGKWLCIHCGCTNASTTEKKCKNCKTLRAKDDEEDHEDKPAYSQSTAKLLEETDPDKIQETIDKKEKEIIFLQGTIQNAKAWVQENPMFQQQIDNGTKGSQHWRATS